jgi:hypothetical protein
MKIKLASFALLLVITLLAGSLNAQLSKESIKAVNAEKISRNILLDSLEVDSFTTNYKRRYTRLFNKKHTKWIYFPRNYFIFIDSFFKKETSFKGIRFHFGSYDKKIDPTQQARDKQITLLIAPADNNNEEEFEKFIAFNKTVDYLKNKDSNRVEMCPNGCKTSITSKMGPEHFILLSKKEARSYIDNYKNKFYDSSKKHSKSLYMDKENFSLLGDFFNSPSGKDFDGVRISFASYHNIKKGTYQAHKKP